MSSDAPASSSNRALDQVYSYYKSIVELIDSPDSGQAIQETPLSVQVKSAWQDPCDCLQPAEFEILLATGGPATRIIGDLDEHRQPRSATLEYQDWDIPWTTFYSEDANWEETLLQFASQFYYGE